jgi:hypothetical protein
MQRLRNGLLQRLPVFELRSMIDSSNHILALRILLTTDSEFRWRQRCTRAWTYSGQLERWHTDLLWGRDGGAAQQWMHRRSTRAITMNPQWTKLASVAPSALLMP